MPVPTLKPPEAAALKLGIANDLVCRVPNVGVTNFGADGTSKEGVEVELNEVGDDWTPHGLGASNCAKVNIAGLRLILSWHKSGLNLHVISRRQTKALERTLGASTVTFIFDNKI